MNRIVFLAVGLLPLTAHADPADGQPPATVTINALRDAEWYSYREAYKGVVETLPLVRPRPLIRSQFQILPLHEHDTLEGIRVELVGSAVTQEIEVDAIGRFRIKLLSQPYIEDAVLRLNRAKGHFRFIGGLSIRENDSGVYSAQQLREACEQQISAEREGGGRFRLWGKQCVGVKFIYPLADPVPAITFQDAGGESRPISAVATPPFRDSPINYRVAVYRFAQWPAHGSVMAGRALYVGAVFE